MTSTIKVDTIQNSAGTTGISIDSSGQASIPKAKLPSFHIYRNSYQSVATATETTILFDSNYFLYGWTLDTSTGILTAGSDAAGIYSIHAVARANTGVDNNANIKLMLNGTAEANGIGSQYCYSEYYQGLNIDVLYEISAGDTLRLRATQNTGSAVNFGGQDAGNNVRLHGFRISA